MKAILHSILLFQCVIGPVATAQELDKSITVEERTVAGDSLKRYYLIRHRLPPAQVPKEYGLLLVLPGGDGGTNFLPFCANVLTLAGTPKDFIVAELVAPIWNTNEAQRIAWPGKAFPDKAARFNSEEFVDAVINDAGKNYKIHDGWVFTLGWSSSGHVIYSSSFENPKIRGSFVAMSRFQPDWFAHPGQAKGKRYYLWHSPADTICPYAESESAAAFLSHSGAATILKSYQGGHGWVPFTFYGDRINEALEWFRAGEADAQKMQATIKDAKTGK